MKRIFSALAVALVLAGCAKQYDDTELKNRVTTLETKVGNLEAQMKAANAVALGQYVQKVEKTDDGVTVTYGDGTVVTLKISGGSGAGSLGVIKKGNDLVWAIDGEALQFEGKDLLVSQVTNIYVKNGKLYAVIAGTETELGGFSGGTSLQDGIFKNIEVTATEVVLTLSDNSTVKIPIASAFRLNIAKTHYEVKSTDPFDVAYTVQAKIAGTEVDIFTDGNYSATVESDKFVITPKAVVEGTALAYADSKVGLTSIVKLYFGGEAEQDYANPTDEKADAENGIDYIADDVNGSVEAHIVSNVSLDKNSIKPQVDWISVVDVKANNYTITLALEDNTTEEIRTGEVYIYEAGTEKKLQTIVIAQKAKTIEYEYYNPTGWNKVFNMADYKTNSTFKFAQPLTLSPSAVTFQWKFYSNKWNNHKFQDVDANNNPLYCNRLGEFANSNESQSILLRFSNDGNADGQLCLNFSALGKHQRSDQIQVSKDSKPYVWATGEWVVFTLVADGSKLYIYDNATLVNAYDYTPASADFAFQRFDLSMTWDDGSNWPLRQAFNGYSAYTRVWSRALSQEEIAAGLCDVASDAEGLEIYWKYDGSDDKAVINAAAKNTAMELDFTSCWDGNGSAKDNGDVAAASWVTLAGSDIDGICSKVKENGGGTEPTPNPTPDPTDPVLNGNAFELSPELSENWLLEHPIELTNATLEWRFYARSWHEPGMPNRLSGIENKSEQGVMLRFSNGQNAAKGQLHLSASYLLGSEPQVTKDGKAYIFEAEKWHTLSIVMDGTNMSVYDNGEFINQYQMNTNQSFNFERLEFGMSWDSNWDNTGYSQSQLFDGYIDYIRVWTVARSASEIKAGLCDVANNAEGLAAYWRFATADDIDGTWLLDRVGQNDIDWSAMSQMDGSTIRKAVDLSSEFAAAVKPFDGNLCAGTAVSAE